ncbi:hypothetical protein H0I23_08070 [Cellulophaga sp. HaHaR_3_176]|uniref:hypothetical protein n=1 Tax=Cellulophaga sp. HaHaR_3_176 TaxID=1942464 RepID=UPI001C1FFE67|nr:hypothetical protein [Cellulophaga sp. HaHaR_3_176]QWX85583.1 hypothetical protein H0I23_08070 [Cellulophaga sp. HaHaR_3_176]
MKLFKTILFTSMLLLIVSCGEERKKYLKSPLDTIITTHIDTQNYSVILADMDYKEDTDKYFHKYKIIVEKAKNTTETVEDDFDIKTTEWQEVSAITFEDYQEDLGMTILSKKEGVLDKQSTPAGYSNYVGNEKYGRWQTQSNGSSFWAFYGQYHFMSSLFYGSSHRYYRNDYDYYRTNHYGRSSYYGRNKNFGTSTYKNANSSWNSKPKTFKDKVRTNVTRSSSALKSKGYSSSKSYKGSSQTSRNTNRYSNSSSSRSRSGGFGK